MCVFVCVWCGVCCGVVRMCVSPIDVITFRKHVCVSPIDVITFGKHMWCGVMQLLKKPVRLMCVSPINVITFRKHMCVSPIDVITFCPSTSSLSAQALAVLGGANVCFVYRRHDFFRAHVCFAHRRHHFLPVFARRARCNFTRSSFSTSSRKAETPVDGGDGGDSVKCACSACVGCVCVCVFVFVCVWCGVCCGVVWCDFTLSLVFFVFH